MIGLMLAMVRARWVQAATLFFLASVAVAAGVAGPVASAATDAAVVRLEVAHATDRERSISAVWFTDPTTTQAASQFDVVASVASLPGFEVIRGGEITTFGPGPDTDSARQVTGTRVVFREGICEHVTILDGRCPIGTGEMIIGERTATRQGLAAGEVAVVQASRVLPDETIVPDGEPARLTVVGVFRPTDIDDAYWAGQEYFRVTAEDGTRAEPVFTTRPSMERIEHTMGSSYVDAVAAPEALTAQRMATVAAEVDEVTHRLSQVANLVLTDVPDLAQRIENSRDLAGQLGPVAFIPLAAISLFVIYLAVAYGIFGRRDEVGLVALRGVAAHRRWLLATGETVLPILAGAPAGYALGYLGVALVVRLRLGSDTATDLSPRSLPYAALALAVALAVALLGQRRALREPVVDLLRGVPRAAPQWHALTLELLVGVLAVVATLQLRSSSAGVIGLGLLVPGLIMLGVALVAARAFIPLAGLAARAALRRGLLGSGLAAMQLARRPGSQRLFVLLAVAVSMLSFVATGTDVAQRARDARATVQAGAPVALRVPFIDAGRLLAATRTLDPGGEWAMAAMVLEPLTPDDPPILAVDASRLPAAATWLPAFGADVEAVASALAIPDSARPGHLAPLELRGTALELDVAVEAEAPLRLELGLVRLADGRLVTVLPRTLVPGRQTIPATAEGCEEGCRLVSLTIRNTGPGARLVLHAVRQLDPARDVVPPSELGNRERWRVSRNTDLVGSGSALVVAVPSAGTVEVRALGAALPIPVAAAGRDRVGRIVSLDGQYVDSDLVLAVALVPRLGQDGVLADLRYLDQTLVSAPLSGDGEIWLGPAAPADAADQFRALGLAVVDEISIDAAREALAIEGPALAVQFHLAAAAFGVLLALGGLGLVAAVDRRGRATDLRALRVQGLARRIVRRAASWGYLSTVVLAALTGLVGAAVAWVAAGDRLPIFIDTSSIIAPPRWPRWSAVAQPWVVAATALVVAGLVAAWALRRAVARPDR